MGGGGGRGAPGNYQPFSASELRLSRLPSSSDGREEALSFSTLPTSQFALKPSTSDMDLHLTEQQHSLFMQRTGFDVTLEPYSWSWVQNARLNPLHLGSFRRTSDYSHGSGGNVSSSSNSSCSGHGSHAYLSSSAAPGNYHPVSGSTVIGSGLSSSSQQLPGPSSSSSSEPIDISRSSLSVTNSKTIILSNAPLSQNQSAHLPNNTASSTTSNPTNAATTTALKSSTPVAPPTSTPTSTKGVVGGQPGTTTTPQSQSQLPQQQQKVAAQKRPATGTKKSSPQSTAVRQKQDATAATLQQTQVAVQPSTTKSVKKEDKEKKGKVAAERKKSVMVAASGQLEGVTPSSATNHTSSESESSTVNPSSAESATVSATPPTSAATSKDAEPSSKGASDGATLEPMDTSCSSKKSPELNSVPTKAEKPKSADSKGSSSSSSSTLVQKSESIESSKALSAWMMSKPSVSIQQLSHPRKREHNERDGEDFPRTKNRRTLFASADAALITSQFAQQAATIKKEEASIAQPLTVTHALNSAMAGLGASNVLSSGAAGLPISSTEISTVTAAAAAAVSQNMSKLPLSMATTPNLSVAQNSPMKLQQQHQEAVVNSIQDGVAHLAASIGQEKKTVVNAVSASGQAQTLPGNLSVRRSSTGTNGTNSYQEIFHTERMKQALAG